MMITLCLALVVSQVQQQPTKVETGVESRGIPKMGVPWHIPMDRLTKYSPQQNPVIDNISWTYHPGVTSATYQELTDLLPRRDTFKTLEIEERPFPASSGYLRIGPTLSRAAITFKDLAPLREGAKRHEVTLKSFRVEVDVFGPEINVIQREWDNRSRAAGAPSSAQSENAPFNRLPSAGERHWRYRQTVVFIQGRCRAEVWGNAITSDDLREAVVASVLYRILQNPRLAGKNAGATLTVGRARIPVTMLFEQPVATEQALRAAGIGVRRDGYDSILSYQGRSIRVTPFEWSLESQGRKLEMKLPAFNGNDGLVVPTGPVFEALGFRG